MLKIKWVYRCPIANCGKEFEDKNIAFSHLMREHKTGEIFPLVPVVESE